MELEAIILSWGFIASFLIMTFAGFTGFFSKPFYITAGWLAYSQKTSLTSIIIAGTLGHSLGNFLQYEITKRKGIIFFKKIPGFPHELIPKFTKTFNKKPLFWLTIGKITEPVKSFISICAGISKTPLKTFLPTILIGSLIWAYVFSILGFYLGQQTSKVSYIGIFLILCGIGLIIYFQKELGKEKNT